LNVRDASAAILDAVASLETEEVAVREALHRVLAEDVRSPLALPPWDNASMDGYAVRANDVSGASPEHPVTLPVTATIAAGGSAAEPLRAGQAMRIMTGAPVPAGTDSVIRVEDTDGGVSQVRITSDRDAHRNVRPRGEDVERDAVAVHRGVRLGPAHLGMLAAVGCGRVRVHRQPRVAILTSGDELVDVDQFAEVLAGRRIVSSNGYTMEGAVREAGGLPIPLGIVGDDPAAIRARLEGLDCDLLLTTGGVSVGAFDFTRQVLEQLGARLSFWRVRIRPGAPIGFGMLGSTPWLGLPGNPVSAMVTFELFVRPALRRMQGLATPVVLDEAVRINAPLTHFLRAVVTAGADGLHARLTGPQGSGLLSSMVLANALLVVPATRSTVSPGETLSALILGEEAQHADTLGL
jgi:molybdopterin molybdotransferase